MTKEQAQELADLYQAIADGKRIEWRLHERYPWAKQYDLADMPVNVTAGYGEYRISPEPMEAWVNVYKDWEAAYLSKEKAEAGARKYGDRIRCVHMREVMDE